MSENRLESLVTELVRYVGTCMLCGSSCGLVHQMVNL